MTESRVMTGLPRGVLILIGLAATVVVVAGLRSIASILGPVLLAIVLTISALPIRDILVRHGVPRWIGAFAAIFTVYLGTVLLAGSLIVAGAQFAQLVPQYQDDLVARLHDGSQLLQNLGVETTQIQTMIEQFDLGQLAGFITSLLASVLGLATNLAFILALVLFMAVDAGNFGTRLREARAHHAGIVDAFDSFTKGTRTYFLVATVFGLVVAIFDTVLLWIVGVPGALLWGLLAFITNYIPNVGFLLGLIPPAVLALLEGGPGMMLVVIAGYSVLNVVIQSLIQPKLVGDAVGLSATVTFLSLIVWAWVLGPLGAVLAVPLTLLVKALFIDVDPNARWIAGLLGDNRTTPAGLEASGKPEESAADGDADDGAVQIGASGGDDGDADDGRSGGATAGT